MNCEDCNNYERDENNEHWGYCSKLHRDVEWNDSPKYTDCGEE